MKFCDFFGSGDALIPSRLAAGWQMPGRLEAAERLGVSPSSGVAVLLGRPCGTASRISKTSLANPPTAPATSCTAWVMIEATWPTVATAASTVAWTASLRISPWLRWSRSSLLM